MYDRRLDAIVAASELGSFSRAAERLSISTPALVKQVSGFESEYGVTVFERSHAGVEATEAGKLLVESARSIIQQSETALRRARDISEGNAAVRLGVSLMCPGKNTLALWPRIHELEPGLRLEIVQIEDLYDERTSVMTHLGETVDIIQSSYSTTRWGGNCKLLSIFQARFSIDVPRTCALAQRPYASIDDLAASGMRLRILHHGNDAMDRLRDRLLARGDVNVIDVDSFDFGLFNDAEEKGDAVLTCGAWSGVHPAFTGVTLDVDQMVPCFLAYSPHPSPQVARFVSAMRRALDSQGAGREDL